MARLVYFEIRGNSDFLSRRGKAHGFDMLLAKTTYGISGLCPIEDLATLLVEMRNEPGLAFRILVQPPDAATVSSLEKEGISTSQIKAYVFDHYRIFEGDWVLCERAGASYRVLATASKSDRQNPGVRPPDSSRRLARFGQDFSLEQADLSQFDF